MTDTNLKAYAQIATPDWPWKSCTPAPVDPESLTAADLEDLRRAWILEAVDLGILDLLETIARELGTRYEHELPYGWNQVPAWRFPTATGELVQFSERRESWDPGRRDYRTIKSLTVTFSGGSVVRLTWDPIDGVLNDGAFFRPGAWMDAVLPWADLAQKIRNNRIQTGRDQKAADLRALLRLEAEL